MLRFRPILPKPTTESELSVTNQNVVVSKRRAKRKYVRVRRNNNGKSSKRLGKREEQTGSPAPEHAAALVTLQLMPERGEVSGVSRCNRNVDLDDLTVEEIRDMENLKSPCATAVAAEVGVVESWVTVESVTCTCMGEGEGLGCTDVEKVKNLETDTCPGFVSDGCYKVRWVNDAYKRMVMGEEPWPEIVVWLKVKDSVEWCCYSYPAFTCGVRLQYTWRNEKCTKMVPCDVWRLDCGGFAWKLDVKAALSLGL
ncbi:uncharacterized protein LOC133285725 [Gastrolobium bilobum]|uniref:uncharacterized protein LOC133285725 n=1 Tax=Gastrolobium bilobum TaxID=150636 RepID=UPI002AB18E14|nr:uncharacterized protein LOC133285725 [Gastrolobium bilobum]